MSHLVTISVIKALLCLGFVQHVTSSILKPEEDCHENSCPQGEYCKSSSRECEKLLPDGVRCYDPNSCAGNLKCRRYRKETILVCQRATNRTLNCHGTQCYVGQYCSKKYSVCWNLRPEGYECEGENTCEGSLKCLKKDEKYYCTSMTTTTVATTVAATQPTTDADKNES